MEHIKLITKTGRKTETIANFWRIEKRLNDIMDQIDELKRKKKG